MSDDMDERYPSAREHWRLVERVATVEADMRQIGPSLARIETTLAAKMSAPPPPPQETAAALALHRALDALPKQQGGSNIALIILAMIGVAAIAFAVGKFFF